MPHLSPMLWILTPPIFLIILLIASSIFWWSQFPNICIPISKKMTNFSSWKWN